MILELESPHKIFHIYLIAFIEWKKPEREILIAADWDFLYQNGWGEPREGESYVASDEGKGTAITITFPLILRTHKILKTLNHNVKIELIAAIFFEL